MSKEDERANFLAIGDVHGHWESVIEAIDTATSTLGFPPDLVLQVGDAEPLRNQIDLDGVHTPKKYRKLGTFSALSPGDLRSPVYFVAGNHEPYPVLDGLGSPFPVPWGDDGLGVYYLGRGGATVLEGKLTVAWLSGIYSPKTDANMRPNSIKVRTYSSNSEVAETLRAGSKVGQVDVLVTHDWPSGLGLGHGNDVVQQRTETLHPKLHICGHMHRAAERTIGATAIHALNAVPPATGHEGRERLGWWRLYERDSTGSIHCLAMGC